MNDNIYYNFFEDLHQIEYSQSSTMKILLIILYYLSSYFMSLTTMFSILILNEHIFKQEKKLKTKKKNKRHLSSKFLLDKIISLKDLNLINQCFLGNKQNTIYQHFNFLSMTTSLPHKIQNTRKKNLDIKIQQEYFRHCIMECFRIYKISLGFN